MSGNKPDDGKADPQRKPKQKTGGPKTRKTKLTASQISMVDLLQGVRGWEFEECVQFCKEQNWNENKIQLAIQREIEFARPQHEQTDQWETVSKSKKKITKKEETASGDRSSRPKESTSTPADASVRRGAAPAERGRGGMRGGRGGRGGGRGGRGRGGRGGRDGGRAGAPLSEEKKMGSESVSSSQPRVADGGAPVGGVWSERKAKIAPATVGTKAAPGAETTAPGPNPTPLGTTLRGDWSSGRPSNRTTARAAPSTSSLSTDPEPTATTTSTPAPAPKPDGASKITPANGLAPKSSVGVVGSWANIVAKPTPPVVTATEMVPATPADEADTAAAVQAQQSEQRGNQNKTGKPQEPKGKPNRPTKGPLVGDARPTAVSESSDQDASKDAPTENVPALKSNFASKHQPIGPSKARYAGAPTATTPSQATPNENATPAPKTRWTPVKDADDATTDVSTTEMSAPTSEEQVYYTQAVRAKDLPQEQPQQPKSAAPHSVEESVDPQTSEDSTTKSEGGKKDSDMSENAESNMGQAHQGQRGNKAQQQQAQQHQQPQQQQDQGRSNRQQKGPRSHKSNGYGHQEGRRGGKQNNQQQHHQQHQPSQSVNRFFQGGQQQHPQPYNSFMGHGGSVPGTQPQTPFVPPMPFGPSNPPQGGHTGYYPEGYMGPQQPFGTVGGGQGPMYSPDMQHLRAFPQGNRDKTARRGNSAGHQGRQGQYNRTQGGGSGAKGKGSNEKDKDAGQSQPHSQHQQQHHHQQGGHPHGSYQHQYQQGMSQYDPYGGPAPVPSNPASQMYGARSVDPQSGVQSGGSGGYNNSSDSEQYSGQGQDAQSSYSNGQPSGYNSQSQGKGGQSGQQGNVPNSNAQGQQMPYPQGYGGMPFPGYMPPPPYHMPYYPPHSGFPHQQYNHGYRNPYYNQPASAPHNYYQTQPAYQTTYEEGVYNPPQSDVYQGGDGSSDKSSSFNQYPSYDSTASDQSGQHQQHQGSPSSDTGIMGSSQGAGIGHHVEQHDHQSPAGGSSGGSFADHDPYSHYGGLQNNQMHYSGPFQHQNQYHNHMYGGGSS